MSLASTNVSSVMNPDVKTDTEEQNIMSACKIMHDNNIGTDKIPFRNRSFKFLISNFKSNF